MGGVHYHGFLVFLGNGDHYKLAVGSFVFHKTLGLLLLRKCENPLKVFLGYVEGDTKA